MAVAMAAPAIPAVSTGLDWFKAASPLLGAMLGGVGGAPPAISSASAMQSSSMDGSGWIVATGGSSASQAQIPWPVYILAGVALLVWYRTKA